MSTHQATADNDLMPDTDAMCTTVPTPATNDADFPAWFAELKRLAVAKFGFTKSAVDSFDEVSWGDYFLEGYTPETALVDDATYD